MSESYDLYSGSALTETLKRKRYVATTDEQYYPSVHYFDSIEAAMEHLEPIVRLFDYGKVSNWTIAEIIESS